MSVLAVFGQTSPQRMSTEEVGQNIGSALHAGIAITQGDVRQSDIHRDRLKLGAQAIMQAWRDLDSASQDDEGSAAVRATADRLERRNASKRPALARSVL